MSTAQIALVDSQLELLGWKPPASPQQDGDLDIWKDGPRLNSLMFRTFRLMMPPIGQQYSRWFEIDELETALDARWSSIGSRLRDMRKPKFKCPCDYEHDERGAGVFVYRLVRREMPWPIAGRDYRSAAE